MLTESKALLVMSTAMTLIDRRSKLVLIVFIALFSGFTNKDCVDSSTVVIKTSSCDNFIQTVSSSPDTPSQQQQLETKDVFKDDPPSAPITRRLSIPSNATILFRWQNIPPVVAVVLFQAHSQIFPLTMSYSQQLTSDNHVNSTNTGLIVQLTSGASNAQVFVYNGNYVDLDCLLVITSKPWQDPIPGGCNMEFPVEISPFLRVTFDQLMTTVDYQRSLEGYNVSSFAKHATCDKSVSSLEYAFYKYFLRERDLTANEYFRAITSMLTVDSITTNALQSGTKQFGPMTRVQFAVNPGQGVIYNVIVRSVLNHSRVSVYTPAGTYACQAARDFNTCLVSVNPYGWVISIILAIGGFLLCFFGHRIFKTELFVFGFLATSLVSYILLNDLTEPNQSVHIIVTILIGVMGGLIWLTFWWFVGIPVLVLLLVGLVLGFLFASIVFYTPFGDFSVFQSDFNYWMTFSCFTLVPVILLLCCIHKLSIVSCAIVGSYLMVLLPDQFLGTSLFFIVANVINRATIPDFYKLNVDTPFQTNDVILSAIWGFLVASGIIFQVIRESKRPPFPPSPYVVWRTSASLPRSQPGFTTDERQPLLVGSRPQQSYNTSAAAPRPPPLATATLPSMSTYGQQDRNIHA